ncbi:hypothetical protein [Infirmifilum sp. SLHALR2]
METARRTTIATLLLALAIVAFATATATLVNKTEWIVKAEYPPVVKVAGNDVATGLVTVSSNGTRKTSDGVNWTTITVVGFKGDPTTYTSVLKICNKGTRSVTVTLKYKGVLGGGWDYVKYIKLLYPSSNQEITIQGGTPSGSISFPLSGGSEEAPSCSGDIGVEVLVTPDAPTNQVLIAIQVDVESQLSTSQTTP